MHYVTATAIDWIGNQPALIEVRLPEVNGDEAVILGRAPLLNAGALRDSRMPMPLDLRCDVVSHDDDHTVVVRLRYGLTDQRGRDTFRVAAAAVRPENPRETFDRLLLNHHVHPENLGDVESAWLAFTEFTQTEIDHLDPAATTEADGFIVQWGRYSWIDRTAALTFTRRLALLTDDGPGCWQVSLDMRFPGFHTLPTGDTGLDFTPVGPGRAAALAQIRATIKSLPQLYALWRAVPRRSTLTFELTE
ncbi:hypothetical protein [Actinoplanes derwentensis]|uniref:Uncharacterized protein n=1 Tax=Actinoplanes derwentensis TaxID=113562 RepID=A0A1H1W896_9ACTN|nr:hypothetical protein [Actinoplanes derwentensis]GID84059.1 hypothetical protein Ade03nite_29830 [Actinoplanes derwentensis]SDS92389.1 hypothetical protein SAMN04489716_1993 [Actinoplanes derwentensis]